MELWDKEKGWSKEERNKTENLLSDTEIYKNISLHTALQPLLQNK